MSNQSKDRKISKFLAQSSLPSDAKLTYISGNTNYRISLSDFQASLGVTGTLEQDGAVTGTPILNTSGSVNNIRNLEAGAGIKTSVSPENGATIEHSFTQDSSGAQVIEDLTAATLAFRSFVAGAGINVSQTNGEIQIALSGIPVSTKTVIVNDVNDFPAAVAGVITLANDTEYAIRNDISTSNRFVMSNNTVLSGSDASVIALTYTGAGNMFTSSNTSWTIKDLSINCTSGTFVDFDGSGAEILQALSCVITADILGTIDNFAGIHFDDTQQTVTTNGFLFGGVNGVILLEANLSVIAAGTLYDLGTATFSAFSITDAFATLNGTSVFLDGAASSGNITAGNLGSVHNCRFFGTGTPLQTITSDDLLWQFHINDSIDDTHKDCLVSLTNNATATTIAAINTPTLVAGTWNPEHESHFTGDANGRCTYNGLADIHVDISIAFSSAPVSGSNKIIGHYAAVNGSVISNSEAKNNISAGDLSRTTVLWRAVLSTGDYVEAFVENETDAVDILVTDAVIRVS